MTKIDISYESEEELESLRKMLENRYTIKKRAHKKAGKKYKKTYMFIEPK